MKDLLVIIPAKAHSQRLKNKNLQKVGKLTLVENKIIQCLKLNIPSQNIVLSSDSKKILSYQCKYKLYIFKKREKKYCQSNSSTFAVILDVLRKYKNLKKIKYVCVLPVTNPLLNEKRIKSSYIKLKKNKNANSIVSIVLPKVHPFQFVKLGKQFLKFNCLKIDGKVYSDYERTQEWPKSYVVSPALKITKINFFLKYLKNNSHNLNKKTFDINKSIFVKIDEIESLDINDKDDLIFAQKIYRKN